LLDREQNEHLVKTRRSKFPLVRSNREEGIPLVAAAHCCLSMP
jgi:hypothetical protein